MAKLKLLAIISTAFGLTNSVGPLEDITSFRCEVVSTHSMAGGEKLVNDARVNLSFYPKNRNVVLVGDDGTAIMVFTYSEHNGVLTYGHELFNLVATLDRDTLTFTSNSAFVPEVFPGEELSGADGQKVKVHESGSCVIHEGEF
ncbi:MAG: hypothetical protein JKY60_10830 [Kordiimonadaceae bacterium]|nr:hypothetical protein [Kordiimonadaceae bacterium]